MSDKSVLDSVPVVETPSYKERFITATFKGVVGNCPNCGAPIYGPQSVDSQSTTDKLKPYIRYSCDCRLTVKNLEIKDTMKTT